MKIWICYLKSFIDRFNVTALGRVKFLQSEIKKNQEGQFFKKGYVIWCYSH